MKIYALWLFLAFALWFRYALIYFSRLQILIKKIQILHFRTLVKRKIGIFC